jgi:hypothetical protein
MEAIRPYVDERLFDLLSNHKFSKRDFYGNKDGGVRLTLKRTPILSETQPLWANKVEQVIEQVKSVLMEDGSLDVKRAE